MANAFEPKSSSIPLKQKPRASEQTRNVQHSGLTLPAPKPKRKQCSLYLSEDMMERVRRIARQQGVTIGAVIEACVKTALEHMEE